MKLLRPVLATAAGLTMAATVVLTPGTAHAATFSQVDAAADVRSVAIDGDDFADNPSAAEPRRAILSSTLGS